MTAANLVYPWKKKKKNYTEWDGQYVMEILFLKVCYRKQFKLFYFLHLALLCHPELKIHSDER